MIEVVCILAALSLAKVRDPHYLDRLHTGGSKALAGLLARHKFSPGFAWALFALAPALLAGALDAALREAWLLRLLLALAVVVFAWDIARFRYYNSRVIQALYGNDSTQVEYLLAKWEGGAGRRQASLGEMLGMCGKRLCNDLFLTMFWFGVLGVGGAVLGVAHSLVRRAHSVPEGIDRVVRLPVEMLTVLIAAIAGNFGPAISKLHASRPVESAAVAAAGIDPEHVHIEQVPDFRRLMDRVFWSGFVVTAVLALVFR